MSKDNEFLTPSEAAKLLRVAPVTLLSWRQRGDGPPWSRVGPKTIRYRRSELEKYLADTLRQPDVATA